MIIPSQLKIGAHIFAVIRKDIPKCGETDYCKQTIVLDEQLYGTMLDVTLIHEILHVCNSELDHTLLDSLAQQIYAVLHDNGMLKEPPLTKPSQFDTV